ncbi:hypothetical protein Tco_0844373 [Tanacetum coccineum]
MRVVGNCILHTFETISLDVHRMVEMCLCDVARMDALGMRFNRMVVKCIGYNFEKCGHMVDLRCSKMVAHLLEIVDHVIYKWENDLDSDSKQLSTLLWPTIVQEDGTTRKKTYAKLSANEKLQDDCDCKATNIVLQGLPSDVYAIVNHHKVAKEIWDRVKLLMQGTKLSLQEKECKLNDEFDKFSFVIGETLYQYY